MRARRDFFHRKIPLSHVHRDSEKKLETRYCLINFNVAARLRETTRAVIKTHRRRRQQLGALPPRGSERPLSTYVRLVGAANWNWRATADAEQGESLSLSPPQLSLPSLAPSRSKRLTRYVPSLSLSHSVPLSLALYSLSSRQSVTLCAPRSPPADRLTRSSTAGDDPFSLQTISYTGPHTTNSIPFPTVVRGANMLPRVCTVPSSSFPFPSRCCFPPLLSHPSCRASHPRYGPLRMMHASSDITRFFLSFLSPHAHRPAWRYDAVSQSTLATGGNRKKKKKIGNSARVGFKSEAFCWNHVSCNVTPKREREPARDNRETPINSL